MLRLFRKHPDVIPVTDWADKIIFLMDEHDLVNDNSLLICLLTII